MTKTDIVDRLTGRSGLMKKEVAYIIDNFIEKIKESVLMGESVEIRGFGTFYLAEKKARTVVSPIAGRKIEVPAKRVLAFRPSKSTEQKETEKGA
ncbi:MAG: HU family DNA-binding protein [Spirochaetes bacterium]|nr:HU family DNA-binding protein [Spirochaetota bacterium]